MFVTMSIKFLNPNSIAKNRNSVTTGQNNILEVFKFNHKFCRIFQSQSVNTQNSLGKNSVEASLMFEIFHYTCSKFVNKIE